MKTLRLLPCLISMALMAQDNIDLHITPGLCVIENDGDVCSVQLQARWQHAIDDQLRWCLHQDDHNTPLFCESEQQVLQRARWPAQLPRSTTFRLQAEQAVIAQAQVKVVQLVTDVRPRRRHGWGLM